jgi:hypothetical protein
MGDRKRTVVVVGGANDLKLFEMRVSDGFARLMGKGKSR